MVAESIAMTGYGLLSAGIGAGLALIGGGIGMGKIAASANEGISRQPEATGQIRGITILIAAMLEGTLLLGLVVTVLLALGIVV